MDTKRFDRITRALAARRRSRPAAAQEATPEIRLLPSGEDTSEKTFYLFVQSFRSGGIAPTKGQEGSYTVTLEGGLGQTVYFADRPSRDVGALPTPDFLSALGFEAGNGPNAALVLETGVGESDFAVVELGNPVYDAATRTASYDVAVLENWRDGAETGFSTAPRDLAAATPSFGAAHLFIDDCPSLGIECVRAGWEPAGWGFVGIAYCWNGTVCAPCSPEPVGDMVAANELWRTRCNRNIAGYCKGTCDAVWRSGSPWNGK